MSKKYLFTILITAIVVVGLTESRHFFTTKETTKASPVKDESSINSPYVGQEKRGIKALSQDDVEGLLAGAGTPLGGLAKPAELNGYPGPRHILDAIEAKEFDVSAEQKTQIEKLYAEMKPQAMELGKQIIDIEQKIDDGFADKTVNSERLRDYLAQSADIYGQLRFMHLKYHLSMMDVLTPKQVEKYNILRGYVGDNNPCENIPEGHDSAQWKLHNNCE